MTNAMTIGTSRAIHIYTLEDFMKYQTRIENHIPSQREMRAIGIIRKVTSPKNP